MNAIELIKQVRALKGKLHAPLFGKDDYMLVTVEKSNFIAALQTFGNIESGYRLFKTYSGDVTIEREE